MADLCGTILDGKYELSRLLGEGGMGTVYEATHKLIGRQLAVKFLHPQYITSEEVVTRFQREARATSAIGHENIIEVTDMGIGPDDAPYIVMEYLDGADVKQVLANDGRFDPERAAHIMIQALSALQAAHDAHIIHRDLKPENIYLVDKAERPDYVKLLDFGISKFKALEDEGAKSLTQTGTVLGTPYYMSPEQARGDQDLTARSDVYAMGVILYQMLTGELPFDGPNYNALLIKILTDDPIPPEQLRPDLPVELVETIKIAMSREAADRFADCLEFRQRLIPYLPDSSGIRMQTALSPASQSAVKAALATTNHTPLEMTETSIRPPRSKMPFILGGAGVASVALFAALFFTGVFDTEETVATATVPVAANTADETPSTDGETEKHSAETQVMLKITANPKDAVIRVDDKALEGNPFEGTFEKDDITHTLTIDAEGYETETAEIKFESDQILSYNLAKKVEIAPKDSKKRGKKKARHKPKPKPVSSGSSKPPKKPKRKIDDEDPWS